MLKRTNMQHLLKCLEDHKYVNKFRNKCESTTVPDIFQARAESIKLSNTFSNVLIMDFTYKTIL